MEIYRSRSSQVWGWLCVGLGGFILASHLIVAGLEAVSIAVGVAFACVGTGIAAFLRPSIAVGADHVELRNVTQTVRMPFDRLSAIEAHWSLELVADDGTKVGAFAAPSRTGRDRIAPPTEGASAEVASLVMAAWDAYRARHATGDDDVTAEASATHRGPAMSRRLDGKGLACVGLAVAGVALALLGMTG